MPDRILRPRRGSFAVGGKRRQTEWFASANISAETALAANTFLFSQSFTAAELAKRPFTITRTVGSLWVRPDVVSPTEFPFGAMGFIVVSEKAVATGVTAIPDPITQEASDEWFVYTQWLTSVFAATAASISTQPYMEHKFDSRAQRKVQDGEDVAVVISNANAAHGCAVILKFRMLIKVA